MGDTDTMGTYLFVSVQNIGASLFTYLRTMNDSINTAQSGIKITIPYIFALFLPYQNRLRIYTRTSGIAENKKPSMDICPKKIKKNIPG